MHDLDISIMLTFQNGDGTSEDYAGGHNNEEFLCKGVYSEIRLQKDENFTDFKKKKKLLNGFIRSNDEKEPASNQFSNSFDESFVIISDSDDDANNFEENEKIVAVDICHIQDDKSYSNVDIDVDHLDTCNRETVQKSSKDITKIEMVHETFLNGNSSSAGINSCSDKNFSTHEMCEIHNVRGVLMHHHGLQKSFALAIAALQVIHVSQIIKTFLLHDSILCMKNLFLTFYYTL